MDMKKIISKLKVHPVVLTLVLGVMLFFGNSFRMTQAQTTAPVTPPDFSVPAAGATDASGQPLPTDNLCVPKMQYYASQEMADFRTFLDTNFQNKASTSSLVPLAIAKYRQMRTELYTAYGKYYPSIGSAMTVTTVEPEQCSQIIDQTLSDAQTLLKDHALRTSGVKKSSALLEKLQQINGQLATLYQNITYMKTYLDTFSGKLPCYPKSGCVKG
jgi:hypothetical protein